MKMPRWLAWILPRPPLTTLLTPRAQQAFALSRRVAFENIGSGSVDTEHLLAALLRQCHEGIVHLLHTGGIDVSELRSCIDRPGAVPATPAEALRMPFLRSIKRSLSAAVREARKTGDEHVGVEHLLLGLMVCGEGGGADALLSRGLTLERARTIFHAMRETSPNAPSSRVLVMFDVDGTLTESFDLDSALYVEALRQVFGFGGVSDDWAQYRHVTDTGILAEIVETRLGCLPTPAETTAMQNRFVDLMTSRIDEAGGVRPVPCAAAMLSRLLGASDRYAVAYASGGWGATARLKLLSAGLPVDGVPGAFADDDPTREGICRAALGRARERERCEFSCVVYIGDGVWDVRTSRNLGFGFVGIGQDDRAGKLRSEGTTEVRPDFQDADAFLAAVDRVAATLPASSRSGETTESAH